MTHYNIHLKLVHAAKLVPAPFFLDRPKGRGNLATHERKFTGGDEDVLGSSCRSKTFCRPIRNAANEDYITVSRLNLGTIAKTMVMLATVPKLKIAKTK
jgi:hypothetical protein